MPPLWYILPRMRRLAVFALVAAAAAADEGYHVLSKIRVGGPTGWDYLTMDSAARRLYVSNGTRVVVIDVDAAKIVGEIPDTQGVHGIALAPALHRGFTSNGRTNNVTIFDLKTLKPIGQPVATGQNPDSIVYDPASRRVFTFNGRSHDSSVIDAKTGETVATIALGGKPEYSAVDGKGNVYVNIEDTAEIVAIDAKAATVVRRSPLAPCQQPSGLAIDTKGGRLFSVCHNNLMAITDADSGKLIATPPIGSGVDGAGFDSSTGIAFSSNGEGTLTMVKLVNGKYTAIDNVPTERGARTMAVDEKKHRIYLSSAEFGSAPAPTEKQPRPRPPVIPDSFHIVVVGRQ